MPCLPCAQNRRTVPIEDEKSEKVHSGDHKQNARGLVLADDACAACAAMGVLNDDSGAHRAEHEQKRARVFAQFARLSAEQASHTDAAR